MKKSDTVSILFCGIGGQGVLTAAEICSRAALNANYHVKKSEVHGMAQRGGSVESHVRFGTQVYSPLIPLHKADVLVPFFKAEHERLQKFLKPEGVDLLAYLEYALKTLKDKRFLNTCILGRLSCHLPMAERCWLDALADVFGNKNLDDNKDIFLTARKQSINARDQKERSL